MFEKSPNEWGIASVLQKPSILDPYFPSPWQSKYKHLTEVVPITQWLWNRSQWSEEEGTLQMFSGDRWLEWLQLNAEASLINGCIPRGGSCDSVSAVSVRQTSIIWFPEAVQLCLWLIRSVANQICSKIWNYFGLGGLQIWCLNLQRSYKLFSIFTMNSSSRISCPESVPLFLLPWTLAVNSTWVINNIIHFILFVNCIALFIYNVNVRNLDIYSN